MKVIKKGHADWEDLKGKDISVLFYPGWEDPYFIDLTFSHTLPYHEDPRYPRYYVMDESGGGYSFWESDEVEVEVLS